MTRVPPQRLPTSRPAAAPARAPQPKKPKGASDKKAELEKPQRPKGGGQAEEGGGETAQLSEQPGGGGGPEAGKERESQDAAKHETLWAPDSHAEASEKKEARESAHAERERKEEAKAGVKPAPPKGKEDGKAKSGGPNAPKRQSDGFERTGAAATGKGHLGQTTGTQPALNAQPIQSKSPVNAVAQTRPALAPPPSNRPPDAFQLLHQAQEKGVYFKEDGLGGGQEREDPELAAAVEEAIRLLFGVRGILRVGPGKNMEDEPVVVVVATQGFGEAALKQVPPAVHRFPTLLAIPFDLLPLKKER